MAIFKPFRALAPAPGLADQVCAPPYDVMNRDEAAAMAQGRANSFLRVSRSEILLPPNVDPHAPEVYAKAAAEFARMQREGILRRDDTPTFRVYSIEKSGHEQAGLIGLASIDEYERNIVRRHELTRPDKVADRADHMLALGAQTGIVFLTYKDHPAVTAAISNAMKSRPECDFLAADGSRHRCWTLAAAADLAAIEAAFASMPALYIADGHHRSASAADVRRQLRQRHGNAPGPYDDFLAIAFPESQARILGYHRVLRDLNGMDETTLLARLSEVATITDPAPQPAPRHRGEWTLRLGDRWLALAWKPGLADAAPNAVERLDAALLQRHVLEPLFGIADVRTDKRIDFVGGARGTGELERLVNSADFACAMALHPVSIGELMAVADENSLMPPKSTWFDPKPLDAIASHLLTEQP